MTRLAATLFAALLASQAEAATPCVASKGGEGYWSWRLIDDRKCWYKGPRRDKAELYWPLRPPGRVGGDLAISNEMVLDCLEQAVDPTDCAKLMLARRGTRPPPEPGWPWSWLKGGNERWWTRFVP